MQPSTKNILKSAIDPFVGMYGSGYFDAYLEVVAGVVEECAAAMAQSGIAVYFAILKLRAEAAKINAHCAPKAPLTGEHLAAIWTSIVTVAAAAHGDRS